MFFFTFRALVRRQHLAKVAFFLGRLDTEEDGVESDNVADEESDEPATDEVA